ncbi:N-lysine methyltransferase KMT5A-A [Schistosoma japonicum]|nr:N-lysine methyltransferase KMT5A-A [Schistosoma japonicum]KAH8878384.1 N-lysine methyltransferase KMT5A-A [Schistosoma japonicum]
MLVILYLYKALVKYPLNRILMWHHYDEMRLTRSKMTSVEVSSHLHTLKWEDYSVDEASCFKTHSVPPYNNSSPSLRQTQLNFSPSQIKPSEQIESCIKDSIYEINNDIPLKSNKHDSYPKTPIKLEPSSTISPLNKSSNSITITSPTRILKQTTLTETVISPSENVFKKPLRTRKAGINKRSQVKRSRSVDSSQINTTTYNNDGFNNTDAIKVSSANPRQPATTTRLCKSTSVSPKKNLRLANCATQMTSDINKQNKCKTPLQTQLTSYGIRKTARQYAKEIERERENNFMVALKNNIEAGMKIIQTEEKGRGVIATRTFYEGEFIVEYAGDLISEKLAKQREAVYKQNPAIGSYMFFFVHAGQRYCVDATEETSRLGRLINHSRLKPNCIVKVIPVDGIPRLALFARKPISPGEELLYDYGDRDKESLQLHPWLKT